MADWLIAVSNLQGLLLTSALNDTEAEFCINALKKCIAIVEDKQIKAEDSPISLENEMGDEAIDLDDEIIFLQSVERSAAAERTRSVIELNPEISNPATEANARIGSDFHSAGPSTSYHDYDLECQVVIPQREWMMMASQSKYRKEFSAINLIKSGLALMERIESGDLCGLEEYTSEEEDSNKSDDLYGEDGVSVVSEENGSRQPDSSSEPDSPHHVDTSEYDKNNSCASVEQQDSDDELNKYHLQRSNRGGNVTILSSSDTGDDSDNDENEARRIPRSLRNGRQSHDDAAESGSDDEEEEVLDEDLQDLLGVRIPTNNVRQLRSDTRKQTAFNRSRRRVVLSSDDEREGSDKSDDDTLVIKRRPIKRARPASASSSDLELLVDNAKTNSSENPNVKKKKKEKETADAERQERDRIKRLSDRQKEFNGIVLDDTVSDIDAAFAPTIPKNVVKSILLDTDEKSENPQPVMVHPSLVEVLQPHQAEGIKFLYDTAIESLDRLSKPPGGGILAHCMGLGKTLQVIAFLHTILNHPKIFAKLHRVMIIVPKNVVINWYNEFRKWLIERNSQLNSLHVLEFDSPRNLNQRLNTLKEWFESTRPSVLIINYEMYRILMRDVTKRTKANPTGKVSKAAKSLLEKQPELRKYLQNPDMVICDEGHRLKNADSDLSLSMNKILTRRRICLTGTPMQNNLKEYHCMVHFVKPHLLGTWTEFRNQFASVINKGRTKDATHYDVKKMKHRCHVLNRKLKNMINRKDCAYLRKVVPEKQEYVIHVHLTQRQIDLYRYYLDNFCNISNAERGKALFKNYHIFNRICTHPYQLVAYAKASKSNEVVDDQIEITSDSESISRPSSPELSSTAAAASWYEASNLIDENDKKAFDISNKGMLVMEILKTCETVGDKILLFSQSLESIRFLVRLLQHYETSWFDDHIIDGTVPTSHREEIQARFNDSTNMRLRLMIISTRAGSLGTNFVAANRVIIFDCSWNPSHDTQAMFRTYRIGQLKPVYVYRLVAHGTLESMIYKRQVTKESTSRRVVDAEQVRRHFDAHDLELLYNLDATGYNAGDQPTINPPRDKLLINVFLKLPHAIFGCVAHDSLLAHDDAESLTEEEKKAAWEEYEREKDRGNRNLDLQPAENFFVTSFRFFTKKYISQNQPKPPGVLKESLLDNGVDPSDIYSFALLLATFKEIMNTVPESAKSTSYTEFDPQQFIIESTNTDTVERALIACRNKVREMHRTWGHVAAMRPHFDSLALCPYLLYDVAPNSGGQ